MQDNGLIKLKPGFNDPGGRQATPKDIAENPKQLKILEIESPQLPRALDDVDLAVINGNYALEAGLVPGQGRAGAGEGRAQSVRQHSGDHAETRRTIRASRNWPKT